MSAATFDTLKFANRLKAAGVDPRVAEEQAGAMAEALEVNLKDLATREDLAREMATLRQDMALLEQRMTIKLGSLMMLAVGVVAALVKLL